MDGGNRLCGAGTTPEQPDIYLQAQRNHIEGSGTGCKGRRGHSPGGQLRGVNYRSALAFRVVVQRGTFKSHRLHFFLSWLLAAKPEQIMLKRIAILGSTGSIRSEERRVGKECRCMWSAYE